MLASTLTLANILISSAVAVIGSLPRVNEFTSIPPSTITLVPERVISDALAEWPIVDPSTNTLSTTNDPAVTLLVVLSSPEVSIDVLPSSEPAVTVPIVDIDAEPALGANVLSASPLVYLSSRSDFIDEVTPVNWLILSFETVTPSSILNSEALAVILSKSLIFAAAVELNVVPPIFKLFTVVNPLMVVGLFIVTALVSSEIKLGFPVWPILEDTIKDPAVTTLVPIFISPKLLVILPPLNGPTVTIELLPSLTLNLLSASVSVYLFSNSVAIDVDTPASWLILAAVTFTRPLMAFRSLVLTSAPSKIFNSLAEAVTVSFEILRVLVSITPFIDTKPLDNTIKSASLTCPILEPSIVISPACKVLDLRSLLLISILPKELDIEPWAREPTFTSEELPSFRLNLSSACTLVYLAIRSSFIDDSTPDKWLILLDVTLVTPSKILISPALAVTEVPPICNSLTLTSPLLPYITAALFTISPATESLIKLSFAAGAVTSDAEPELPMYNLDVLSSLTWLLLSVTIALDDGNTPGVAPIILLMFCNAFSSNSDVPRIIPDDLSFA